MKHKFKDIEGSRREFYIEIPAEEIKRMEDAAFEDIKKTAAIPGFRKGKAPRELLEKHHGEAVRERVMNDLVGESYREALAQSKTLPVGLPRISDFVFEDGRSAAYKAVVDIKPNVDLISYDKIKVKKNRVNVKDEDVDKYIAALRESYAQFKTIEDRAAKAGDYLICDIKCEADGKPLYDEQKNIWLSLDKEQPIPELVDGLVDSSSGQVKEIKAALPENHKVPDLSRKDVIFTVKVHSIKEKELPDVTDEFVKGLGGYNTVEELKEASRVDMARKNESQIRTDMGNQILEQFLKGSRFQAPKGLVDEENERLVGDAKEELRRRNLKEEEIEKNVGELKEKFKPEAERRVKLYFILDEIARREGINVTTKELDDMLELIAKQSNTTKDAVRERYAKDHMLGYLKNQLKEGKIIDFLLSKAQIIEEN